MLIDDLFMNNNYQKLCKLIFKVLNCHSLWFYNVERTSLDMLISDKPVFKHYCENKYYLHDPILKTKIFKDFEEEENLLWNVSLGTDCDNFAKCGFIYDLYRLFHIEEFISIEKRTKTKHYCFRFFTRHNRFIFINKFLNDMPIIKHFVNTWIEKYEEDASNHLSFKLIDLRNIGHRG